MRRKQSFAATVSYDHEVTFVFFSFFLVYFIHFPSPIRGFPFVPGAFEATVSTYR